MAERRLGARQSAILSAIVREYIRSGEPVGSKHLVGRYKLDVSSATVRNDMSLLEELGYLTQPHTSAGRIPTDQGYRWFVDTAQHPPRLAEPQEREMREALEEPVDLDEKLTRASDLLSRFTHYASAVLMPRLEMSHLRHLDLARIGPRLVVAVLIGDGGRVEKRIIELDADTTDREVEQVAHEVNRSLAGQALDEAQEQLAAIAKRAPAKSKALYSAVSEAIGHMMETDRRLLLGRTSALAADEMLGAERDTLRRVYEAMEQQTEMLRMLSEAIRPVSVRIGTELPLADLHSCSIVIAPYGADVEGGTVGVIGPTRMDYLRAMSIVGAVARTLEASLRELDR